MVHMVILHHIPILFHDIMISVFGGCCFMLNWSIAKLLIDSSLGQRQAWCCLHTGVGCGPQGPDSR